MDPMPVAIHSPACYRGLTSLIISLVVTAIAVMLTLTFGVQPVVQGFSAAAAAYERAVVLATRSLVSSVVSLLYRGRPVVVAVFRLIGELAINAQRWLES